GRRMLALNDEVWARMTDQAFEGELRLGVPHDIVYPHIPTILRRLDREFPRVKVKLISSYTLKLLDLFEAGDADVVLTTENETPAEAECIATQELIWVGAQGGTAWRNRPLRVAFERKCLFRPWALAALDRAGIPWEMAVDTGSTRTVEATLAADLAINALLEGSMTPMLEPIAHGGQLPELPSSRINLYRSPTVTGEPMEVLVGMIKQSYQGLSAVA
ncbi:MAG: LysR substrate-binding domain-containing protein, partial [Pseudomonadota bacterium]